MEYTGTKSYNKSFTDEGMVNVKVTTVCTVENLVPGTRYRFQVYAISECGTQGPTTYIDEETRLEGKDIQASKQEIAVKMIYYAAFAGYMNHGRLLRANNGINTNKLAGKHQKSCDVYRANVGKIAGISFMSKDYFSTVLERKSSVIGSKE